MRSDNYEWLNYIPDGWRALAREMIEKCEIIDPTYTIEDLKEKYGSMRTYSYCKSWYDHDSDGTNLIDRDAIDKIEHEYELISGRTCCKCSAPAVKYSTGWILPFCDKCGDEKHGSYKRFKDVCDN